MYRGCLCCSFAKKASICFLMVSFMYIRLTPVYFNVSLSWLAPICNDWAMAPFSTHWYKLHRHLSSPHGYCYRVSLVCSMGLEHKYIATGLSTASFSCLYLGQHGVYNHAWLAMAHMTYFQSSLRSIFLSWPGSDIIQLWLNSMLYNVFALCA